MALVVGANMYLAYRFRPLFRPNSPEQTGLDRYRDAVTPIRTWLLVGVSVLLGPVRRHLGDRPVARSTCCGATAATSATPTTYFDQDIGFYVFDLPWLHYLVDSAMAFTVVALLMAALVHYLYGGIRLQTTHDRLSGAAQAQLSVLLGLFVLAKAADYWLDRFDLVHQSGRLITGMTYTDDHAVLPAKNILMGIAVICAVLFFLNVWRRTWLLPSVGLALLALSAVLLGMIWPGIVQQFQVDPTEADKEAPYIESEHRRHPGGVRPRGRGGRAVHQRGRRSTTPQLGGAGAADLVGAAGRPEAGARRRSSSTSRCAPTTPCADVLDVDRYEIEGERPRARARRPRARPGRHHRGRPELVQPAHRLHPRQRRHRRLRQPAPRGQRARSATGSSGPRASRPTRTPSPSSSPTATRPGSTSAS